MTRKRVRSVVREAVDVDDDGAVEEALCGRR